jgi:hypothetical protein
MDDWREAGEMRQRGTESTAEVVADAGKGLSYAKTDLGAATSRSWGRSAQSEQTDSIASSAVQRRSERIIGTRLIFGHSYICGHACALLVAIAVITSLPTVLILPSRLKVVQSPFCTIGYGKIGAFWATLWQVPIAG